MLPMKLDLLTNATVMDGAIKFLSDKSVEPESVNHKLMKLLL
jgi:hypothetical protein